MRKISIYILFVIIVISLACAQLSETKVISLSLVNQDPDPAIAGDIVEVRLGIENKGGIAAEDLILEIVPEYPFTMVPGEDKIQKIGTIKSYQSGTDMKIVKFKVRVDRDATAGDYELKVKQYEEGEESAAVQRSVSIDVKSKESAEVIYIDKTLLVPGKQDTLKFTINNVGSAPLRDITFSWVNEDKIILPVGSDNTKYIRYIDIGDSAELQYKVIADTNAEAGLYELSLQLTYDDPLSAEEKEINTIAGVYVGGGTDFDVAFSESSAGQTSFTIANVGSNPAFSVSVIIPEQEGWRVSGSNSMIIGNLNTGDYTVASFGLQSEQARTTAQDQDVGREGILNRIRGVQTSNALKVQIAYTNTMGKRELVEKEVNVNPLALMTSITIDSQASTASFRGRRQQGFFSKYKWYIAVLVILIIVGIVYWRYRKEKLLNHHLKFRDYLRKIKLFSKKKK